MSPKNNSFLHRSSTMLSRDDVTVVINLCLEINNIYKLISERAILLL